MMIWVFEHVSGSSPSESLSEQESITWTLTLPAKKGSRPNKNTPRGHCTDLASNSSCA
jgi:hypothetical protein